MASPTRRSHPTTLSLDFDVRDMLKVLSPSSRNYGHFVSTLIRQEFDRRVLRQEALTRLWTDAAPEAQPQEISA